MCERNSSCFLRTIAAQSPYLFTRQNVETLSNFGERALSQLPADQVVSDPFGVVEALDHHLLGTEQGLREDFLLRGIARALLLLRPVAHLRRSSTRGRLASPVGRPPQ